MVMLEIEHGCAQHGDKGMFSLEKLWENHRSVVVLQEEHDCDSREIFFPENPRDLTCSQSFRQ